MPSGYLELKLSWGLYARAPAELNPAERQRLGAVAARQLRIEQAILASPAAADVVVPAATCQSRLAEIRQRYADASSFQAELRDNALDETSLLAAVERDLRVEAILDRVAASCPPVTLVDAEIYYCQHPEAFDQPEARRLRHILITCDTPAEQAKATEILEKLRSTATSSEKFAAAALRHSQCPTAMDGGLLGVVRRQQLYAELEEPAFALAAGELSAVCRSPIGLHLLRCDEILPSGMLPFAEVSAKIVAHLSEKRQQAAQKAWIRSLAAVP